MRIVTQQHIDNFLNYLTNEERSEVTIQKYKRDILSFQLFSDGNGVTKECVIEYKHHLLTCGYAERSVNSMFAALNSFFTYMKWFELRVKPLRISPDIYIPEQKELTENEYFRLVKAARNVSEKLSLIIQTLCSTGMKISELRFVTVEALKKEVIVRCKGKTRKVFVVSGLRKMLLLYAKENGIRHGVIFIGRTGKPIGRTTVWRSMKNLCAVAGVSAAKVFPHNLRHLFARVFYKTEKDIAKLADILGHNSINTTRIYIASSGREHERKLERLRLVCSIRC